MVHFSSIRLPPCEMERQDPVRAEVPPALPVLIPGLAHFLVVGLTDLFCQLDPTYLSHPLFTNTHLGAGVCGMTRLSVESALSGMTRLRVESAPSGMRTSVWRVLPVGCAPLWRVLPVGCAPLCGERSQWDARLSVESAPTGMHASVWRALPVGCTPLWRVRPTSLGFDCFSLS